MGTRGCVVLAGSVLAPVSAPGIGASLLRAPLCGFCAGEAKETKLSRESLASLSFSLPEVEWGVSVRRTSRYF